jgi:hypothetical protein
LEQTVLRYRPAQACPLLRMGARVQSHAVSGGRSTGTLDILDMSSDFPPHEPLSQVAFVHDYLQLRFQDQILTIFNNSDLGLRGSHIPSGAPGFCDAIVGLIGQRVVDMSALDDMPLVLHFEAGAVLRVPCSGAAARGPEAWMFGTEGGPVMVQANV